MALIWTGPLAKPSPLDRIQRKQDRKRIRKREKLVKQRSERDRLRAIRLAVWGRDQGHCRACGCIVYLVHANELKLMHAHHVVYRSAGGSDDLHNRLSLCPTDHQAEHDGLLEIHGEPNGTVEFTRKDRKGNTLHMWSSECPN